MEMAAESGMGGLGLVSVGGRGDGFGEGGGEGGDGFGEGGGEGGEGVGTCWEW